MMNFFIQSIFLFLIATLQISFLNVVFSNALPNALLATAISLILTRGFFASWPWIVFLGCIFDILSMNTIGITPVALILFSYGISFLSRRFLVEHKGSSILLAVLYVIVSAILYAPFLWMVRRVVFGVPQLSMSGFIRYFSSIDVVAVVVSNVILFAILYVTTLKVHHIVHFYEDRVTVKR